MAAGGVCFRFESVGFVGGKLVDLHETWWVISVLSCRIYASHHGRLLISNAGCSVSNVAVLLMPSTVDEVVRPERVALGMHGPAAALVDVDGLPGPRLWRRGLQRQVLE